MLRWTAVPPALPLWVLFSLTQPGAVHAQQIVSPATAARGAVVAAKDGLVLPAGDFTVSELIDATATYLCRNFLYDPNAVLRAKGFSLQRPLALDALGAEELLYALLASRDFAVLPLDETRGVFQIVLLEQNQPGAAVFASTPWRTSEEVLRRPQLREIVFTVIELQHADAQQFVMLLRNSFAFGGWRPGCLVASAAEQRTIVLHGYRDQVANALALAARFDQMNQPDPTTTTSTLDRLQQLEREVATLKELVAEQQRQLEKLR
jgi:type II secretory pathway component GspD/PulD (secretin)